MSDPTPPPAPDYAAAAQQTSAGNASQAQVAQYGSMTNQVTPYGTVNYTAQPMGKTKEGDQLNQWTQTVGLSPSQQIAFDQSNRINAQLGNIAEGGTQYVQSALANPLNFSKDQALQTPGQMQQQASDAAYRNATQYLDPQYQQSNAQLANRLANQGITQGSEAYNNAMLNAGNAQQQAYESARNQAYIQGQSGAQQASQQALQNRQQQISEQQTLQQNPLNMLNAVRTGSQMQTAQMPGISTSAPAALQAVSGPDMLGAATAKGQYDMNTYNQQMASNAAMTSGLMSMGGMLGGAAVGKFASDRRLKKNIKRIGTHALGIGLYIWDYLWGQPFSGVMADEVEKVMPEAIVQHPSGFKMVDYSMLGLA